MTDAELKAYLELAERADALERGTVQGVDCRVRFINRSTSLGPAAAREVLRLRSFIAQTLPFLREAWTTCFDGHETKLLSAEQRGMGMLIGLFKEIADGKPSLPPGVITTKQADKETEASIAWAHRLLGSPNELKDELQEWIQPGETCAHGIERANREVLRLREALRDMAENSNWIPTRNKARKLLGETGKAVSDGK